MREKKTGFGVGDCVEIITFAKACLLDNTNYHSFFELGAKESYVDYYRNKKCVGRFSEPFFRKLLEKPLKILNIEKNGIALVTTRYDEKYRIPLEFLKAAKKENVPLSWRKGESQFTLGDRVEFLSWEEFLRLSGVVHTDDSTLYSLKDERTGEIFLSLSEKAFQGKEHVPFIVSRVIKVKQRIVYKLLLAPEKLKEGDDPMKEYTAWEEILKPWFPPQEDERPKTAKPVELKISPAKTEPAEVSVKNVCAFLNPEDKVRVKKAEDYPTGWGKDFGEIGMHCNIEILDSLYSGFDAVVEKVYADGVSLVFYDGDKKLEKLTEKGKRGDLVFPFWCLELRD